MGRIEETLRRLRETEQKALALFLTAGYPERDATPALVADLARAGADMIELGMPFSDPMADGPVIQKTSQVALKNGTTLSIVLQQVEKIRHETAVPIVLMGYLNPILRYGAERFFKDASESGVDGVILPELPLEEHVRYRPMLEAASLSNILLVTPTTREERVRQIDGLCRGFLYCVSQTGVTGNKTAERSLGYVEEMRAIATHPVLVGFGVATPEDACAYARVADGVIVGSALLRKMEKGQGRKEICSWVGEMKGALNKGAKENPNSKSQTNHKNQCTKGSNRQG